MKYGRYLHTGTNEYVNRAFESEEQYNSIMSRGKKATGGWEPFPEAKVFISFCEPDRTYMGYVRNALLKNNLLEPVLAENMLRPSVDLPVVIPEGINDADFFLVILTEKSMVTQWINQEIGYAFATPKLDGRRFAFVEKKIIGALKGFIHDKMQHPYQFNARGFDGYKRIISTFIADVEQRVIAEHNIEPV